MSRYSFNCTAGCGACTVKVTDLEVFRSETLAGVLIERRTAAQVVSSCCGEEVEIWDDEINESAGIVLVQKD